MRRTAGLARLARARPLTRALCSGSSYGYALRGHAPRSSSGIFSRGERRSYLCGMDMHGIVDFYSLTGAPASRSSRAPPKAPVDRSCPLRRHLQGA